ncbi:MAG: nucleotide sugar dehydrogenase, partial [Nitrosopumilaceae archaeon]|nr:nucleotide sugar dehydrogenase [Nitrosopumilaceae archaeon]
LQSVVQGASLVFVSTDHKVYVKLNKTSFSKASKPLLIFDGRNVLTKNNFKNTSIMTVGMR